MSRYTENTYRVALQHPFQSQTYITFPAQDDAQALEIGKKRAQAYINGSGSQRVVSAWIVRWEPSAFATNAWGRPSGGGWRSVENGRITGLTPRKSSCSQCGRSL